MLSWRGRVVTSLILSAACLAPSGWVTAAEPTNGGSKGDFEDWDTVKFEWDGGPPQYVKTAYLDALQSNYPDSETNNSRSPSFDGPYADASAHMHWKAADDSPCNPDPNPQWLQCAKNWGTKSLHIYVRDLESPDGDYGNWHWWDTHGECRTDNCWYLRRALIHEIGHAAISLGHDESDWRQTIMASNTPECTANNGKHEWFRRCDMARAQLVFDLDVFSGPYADCLDGLADSGADGLKTQLTVTSSIAYLCPGEAATFAGRLQVTNYDSYQRLGGNPLAGRRIWFDKNSTPNYTSTIATAATGGANNWSRTLPGQAPSPGRATSIAPEGTASFPRDTSRSPR
jgi:hypothetical protein